MRLIDDHGYAASIDKSEQGMFVWYQSGREVNPFDAVGGIVPAEKPLRGWRVWWIYSTSIGWRLAHTGQGPGFSATTIRAHCAPHPGGSAAVFRHRLGTLGRWKEVGPARHGHPPQHHPRQHPRRTRQHRRATGYQPEGRRLPDHPARTHQNIDPQHTEGKTMTDNETRDEIAVRRGRIAALEIAKAVHAEQPEAADQIYRREVELGMTDLVNAGAINVLLVLARGFADTQQIPVHDVLEQLWQNEAGTLATLADINNLPTAEQGESQ
ncbi:hypothetical protein [Gordonia hongkongensis]|uniref:hypothetical protein n=1 Tax=Gordonia hongkongensis TaxID=1701090 RepID=UPI003D75C428